MQTYYLEVEKIGTQCRFLLSWGKNQRLSAVVIAYSEALNQGYTQWQQAYLNYYRQALRGRVQGSGSFSLSNVDWYEKLREAEEKLLQEFNFWLRSPELHELWQEVKRSARLVSHQAQSSDVSHIDLLITCSEELIHLPWEAWKLQDEFAFPDTVRIARAVYSSTTLLPPQPRYRPRVLAIFGDETGLDFQNDRAAMKILAGLADIHFLQCSAETDQAKSELSQQQLTHKQKICQAIADEKGWDIIFFSGHSDQTELTGGKLLVAPNTSLTTIDLEPYILQAKQRGLQIAIFNSCNGTTIATWLITKVGIPQAIAMREPIHNQVAQSFLVQFLKNLAQHQDAHTSTVGACRYLQEERLLFPSIYLVPSLFRYPDATLYRIPPTRWQSVLQRILPTPKQAIALSLLLASSFVPTLQEWMLDNRIWWQALYRQQTQRIPKASPPVAIVQIDEASLQKAGIADPHPMDRQYLAKLVERLSAQKAQVIGIDYLLDRSHRARQNSEQSDFALSKSIQSAVSKPSKGSWFVLASVYSEGEWLEPLPDISSKNGSVDGHIHMSVQYLPLVQADVPKLPFAYLIAGLQRIKQNQLLRSPVTENTSLYTQISEELKAQGKTWRDVLSPKSQMFPLTSFTSDTFGQSWLNPIVDFSIPPHSIYQTIPAWQLLQGNTSIAEGQVVLIAANYAEAGVFKQGEDSFPQPAAIRFWLQQSAATRQRENYTGGEVQAYAIHHFLRDRYVVPIPDTVMIILCLAASAILITVWQPRSRRQAYLIIGISLSFYTLASLELYISAALLLPMVMPAIAFAVYCIPKLMSH